MLAFATLDSCLDNACEDFVDYSCVTVVELSADLLYRFSRVCTVKARPLGECLFILKLFKQVDHELVAVMLHDWLEPAPQQLLQCRSYYPASVV